MQQTLKYSKYTVWHNLIEATIFGTLCALHNKQSTALLVIINGSEQFFMPDITEELCSRLINKLFWLIVMQGVLTYTLYLATQHLSTNQILSAKIASVFFIRTGCCKNQIEILRQATQITDVWDNLFMGSSNKIPSVQWQLEKKLLLSWKLTEWTCFLEVRASHGPGRSVTWSLTCSLLYC